MRWCRLALGGATLMLQEFPNEQRDSHNVGEQVGKGVSLYFTCLDAISIYREATEHGLDASEPQVGNSMWETFLCDPDGYRVNFTSPTDVAEETKLSAIEG